MNPGVLQLLGGGGGEGGKMCVWEWDRVGTMEGKEGRARERAANVHSTCLSG